MDGSESQNSDLDSILDKIPNSKFIVIDCGKSSNLIIHTIYFITIYFTTIDFIFIIIIIINLCCLEFSGINPKSKSIRTLDDYLLSLKDDVEEYALCNK